MLLLIVTLVAAGISPFSHRGYTIFMFFSNEIGLLWFLSHALALSLLSTSTHTLKLSRKKESAFVVVVFISKRSGSYAIYRRNSRVLEMQNFIPAYVKGWTFVRTYPVRTISWMHRLPNFLTHGALLRAPRARELRYNGIKSAIVVFWA